jgi:hypothetical protein
MQNKILFKNQIGGGPRPGKLKRRKPTRVTVIKKVRLQAPESSNFSTSSRSIRDQNIEVSDDEIATIEQHVKHFDNFDVLSENLSTSDKFKSNFYKIKLF